MLDRNEAAALAEIEASLRRDDPSFVSMIERHGYRPAEVPEGAELAAEPSASSDQGEMARSAMAEVTRLGRWGRALCSAGAALVALAITLVVTAAWGPDAGGLASVVSIMAATMVGYQLLGGCPDRG